MKFHSKDAIDKNGSKIGITMIEIDGKIQWVVVPVVFGKYEFEGVYTVEMSLQSFFDEGYNLA